MSSESSRVGRFRVSWGGFVVRYGRSGSLWTKAGEGDSRPMEERIPAKGRVLDGVETAGEAGMEEEPDERWPRPVGRASLRMYSSFMSGTICHFMPLPGSSVRRGIFSKALLRERLCRIEFW
jgi:hypothetical protein